MRQQRSRDLLRQYSVDCNGNYFLIYLDDIIVIAKSFDEMMVNLETIFSRLRTAGLKLKSYKCLLFSETVEYLGHTISKQGVATDPKKKETVRDWP